jgi:hypothetical protein
MGPRELRQLGQATNLAVTQARIAANYDPNNIDIEAGENFAALCGAYGAILAQAADECPEDGTPFTRDTIREAREYARLLLAPTVGLTARDDVDSDAFYARVDAHIQRLTGR